MAVATISPSANSPPRTSDPDCAVAVTVTPTTRIAKSVPANGRLTGRGSASRRRTRTGGTLRTSTSGLRAKSTATPTPSATPRNIAAGCHPTATSTGRSSPSNAGTNRAVTVPTSAPATLPTSASRAV